MLRLAHVNRLVVRHRRLVALASVLVVIGVGALDMHAAMCGCDDAACTVCLCVTASAVATVASLGWSKRGAPRTPTRMIALPRVALPSLLVGDAPQGGARAGPGALAVLRL